MKMTVCFTKAALSYGVVMRERILTFIAAGLMIGCIIAFSLETGNTADDSHGSMTIHRNVIEDRLLHGSDATAGTAGQPRAQSGDVLTGNVVDTNSVYTHAQLTKKYTAP
jgi:hypothetical protein